MFLFSKKLPDTKEEMSDLQVCLPVQDAYQEEIDKHVQTIENAINSLIDIEVNPTLNSDLDHFTARDAKRGCWRFKRTSVDIEEFYGYVVKALMQNKKISDYLTEHEVKLKILINPIPNENGMLTGSIRMVPARQKCGCALM